MSINDEFEEVVHQLDEKSVRYLADGFPWPYNGMVNDISGAILTKGNYLAALGLSCYTEICGRQILFQGNREKKDWECYNNFIKFMGAGDLLEKNINFNGKKLQFKDAVRNGFVHHYFMKGTFRTVAMISDDQEAKRLGFLFKEDQIIMIVVPYFKLFYSALAKAKNQGLLKWYE